MSFLTIRGARPCGARPSRRADLPLFAHDGTARRIVRPQAPVEPHASESGKTSDPTVNQVLLVHAWLVLRWRSDTHGGRAHALRLAEAPPSPLPAGSGEGQELGFLSCTLPEVAILMPTQKPRGTELTREQQRANQALHQRRLRMEHGNRSVKRGRRVKDRSRWWKEGVRALVMARCGARHNCRVRLNPWQPMI
jgi:hypothetical protein